MDIALLYALLLGVIEGLTEFLPVSSTGHLILASHAMGITSEAGAAMEVVIQLGAILAVCWFYYKRLWHTVRTLPHHKGSQRFALAVIIATLPAVIIGFSAQDFIKQLLDSPTVVAVMLIVGGILILIIEKKKPAPRYDDVEEISPKLALMIGLCQALAMIPGVSRSGATIMGALLLRVERKTAAEFSFFLSIPIISGAALYDFYKHYHLMSSDMLLLIAVGFVSAFFTALMVIRWFIRFISRNDFTPFAWYRIGFGTLMLAYFTFKA